MIILLEKFFKMIGEGAINGTFLEEGKLWDWDRISLHVCYKIDKEKAVVL